MSRSEMLDLLVEVGTEEIPAAFLPRGLAELERRAGERLAAARLEPEELQTAGTPRRLTLIARSIPKRQPDVSERVAGPPARVAFDDAGKPTKAAVGFAKKNGVAVEDLERGEVEGKKGEYVLCTRREPGKDAAEVLPALLSELLSDLPWPKSMRWGAGEQAFVRPVHWLVVLFGGEVLPVSFAGVTAGRASRGHRFLAPGEIPLDGTAKSYFGALRGAFVLADAKERRTVIAAELARVEGESGARIRQDEELLAEVTDLVEYPVGICGTFDPSYLEVPEEVVVSAMRSHQRYFAMENERGELVNRFATIAGTVTRDASKVRRGNERVLDARLADARFFYQEDKKVTLDAWSAKLSGVVFQAKLGSVGDKSKRIGQNALHYAELAGADPKPVARAAALCKADLVTHMVGEFPDLQGVMGRHYAAEAGEPEAVCEAIEEHYLPRGAADRLPQGQAGALVGLADRADTIVGCFAAGLAPTGSADPYGLRRAALAILQILLDRRWPGLSLDALIDKAKDSLSGVIEVAPEVVQAVLDFFRTRLKGLLETQGLPPDCVEAALAAGFARVPDARDRAEAVARLRSREDFEPLATAFKRVANILKGEAASGGPDPQAFVEEDERALWGSFEEIRGRVDSALSGGDYHGALQVLTELKAPVDRFFESVLVMDKDDRVRKNRLALLGSINATFTRIADFRQLAV